jgi:hypothetical protein
MGATWEDPYYVRTQIPQWQEGNLEVTYPRDKSYSKKLKIATWMYSHAETDWFGWTKNATADPEIGANGQVGAEDLNVPTTTQWQKAPYPYLEADMDANNFINILDISKIAVDYGYDAEAEYGQWPLP